MHALEQRACADPRASEGMHQTGLARDLLNRWLGMLEYDSGATRRVRTQQIQVHDAGTRQPQAA